MRLPFQPEAAQVFRFDGWDFDQSTGSAQLRYSFAGGPAFTETIVFPGARRDLSPAEQSALRGCLQHLHWVAGISYYKAAVPRQVDLCGARLSPPTADFLDLLYTRGLDEFAFRNGLDLTGRVRFPADPEAPPPGRVPLPRRTAVPLGGGKDSVVALEALAAQGEPLLTLGIGEAAPIAGVAAVAARRHAGLRHHTVQRRISPELLRINREGAYNGHIPVSAVYAFVFAAAALLYGFDAIAVGNERSANTGSQVSPERSVNHQISKSLEFELELARMIERSVLPGLRYFSLLRPLSELSISRMFARLGDYHDVFVSCNTAYRQSGGASRWCRDCPKCRFVFLALAPFLPRERLLGIFGANLLDDPAQLPGYRALLGLAAFKPFECVGEIEESRAAFAALAEQADWKDDHVIRELSAAVPEWGSAPALMAQCMDVAPEHRVPPAFLEMLLAHR